MKYKENCSSIIFSDIKLWTPRHSGKYISNMMFDAGQVHTLVSSCFKYNERQYYDCFGSVNVLSKLEARIFAIIMIPLAAGFAKNLGQKVGKATKQASELSGKLISFLSDVFRASKIIKFIRKKNLK